MHDAGAAKQAWYADVCAMVAALATPSRHDGAASSSNNNVAGAYDAIDLLPARERCTLGGRSFLTTSS